MKKILLLFILIILIPGCKETDKIKIGFSGPLTGKNSDFGIEGRNGVIYAVEEINRKDGINGRTIQLYTSDDKGDKKTAVRGDLELINKGVVAIIGHMTSAMTIAVMNLINKKKVVLISPSTSTDTLNHIDDYLIRVIGSTKIEAKNLAEQSFKKFKTRKVGFIYDFANKDYTENWIKNFRIKNRSLGGKTAFQIAFDSQKNISFSKIVRRALSKPADGICIVANSIDTALICQQIRKLNSHIIIMSCAWAQTRDILIHGGKSVEGVIFSHQYSDNVKTTRFIEFRNNYRRGFGRNPEFASVSSYNAAQVVFDALKRNIDPSKLKETILKKNEYQGVNKKISIDKFGDSTTSYNLITIRNDRFVELK